MRSVIQEVPLFLKLFKNSTVPSFLKQYSLSSTQMKILGFLVFHENEEFNQKDLERHFRLRKSTISTVLDTMEKNDLIRRIPSSKDARKKIIQYNKSKIPNKEKIINYFKNMETNLTKDIPQEKMDVFFEVLDLMSENIKKGNLDA